MNGKRLYKNSPLDTIWWVDCDGEVIGEWLFTFDQENFYNLFSDYPHKLTPEQKEVFDKENPHWKEFFSDRGDPISLRVYGFDGNGDAVEIHVEK